MQPCRFGCWVIHGSDTACPVPLDPKAKSYTKCAYCTFTGLALKESDIYSFLLKISTGNPSKASSLQLPWALARQFTEHRVPRPIPHRESREISQPETLLQSSARRVCSSSLIDPLIINTSSLSSWLCFKQGFLFVARTGERICNRISKLMKQCVWETFYSF